MTDQSKSDQQRKSEQKPFVPLTEQQMYRKHLDEQKQRDANSAKEQEKTDAIMERIRTEYRDDPSESQQSQGQYAQSQTQARPQQGVHPQTGHPQGHPQGGAQGAHGGGQS